MLEFALFIYITGLKMQLRFSEKIQTFANFFMPWAKCFQHVHELHIVVIQMQKNLQVISRCCTNTFSKYLDPEATEEGGVEVIGKSFNSLNIFSFYCFFNWYFRHKVESNLSNDLNVVSLVQTQCWANYREGHLNRQKVNRYLHK